MTNPTPPTEAEGEATMKRSELEENIRHAINYSSAEAGSDTPDFILAQYLIACLDAWNAGIEAREKWSGRLLSKDAGPQSVEAQ